jgi:signal transduction histidine kinase
MPKEIAMDTNAIAQWAHDIRNTLGTIALYLESLERLGHADAVRILSRSDELLKKAANMCSDLMREAVHRSSIAPRRRFDVTQTIEEVLGLIAPIVPATTTLSLASSGPVYVAANPKDVFRILFNLIHNAAGVARGAGTMRRIELAVKQNDAIVTIRIADDGPGLPDDIRARLFQRSRSTSGGSGHGLSIARELAERNGAILELADTALGTEFTLELQGIDVDARREVVPVSPALAVLEAA